MNFLFRIPSARDPRLILGFLFGLMSLFSDSIQAQEILKDHFDYEILFEVPQIEHPTVVTCDDDGNLFIGEDPMDMRGPSTEEFDRIQHVIFDEQGRPARKTVFAENLSAVFGMIWHDGALYVMHAPHYTMFKDTDGDGVADVRKELADGFGAPAGIYGFNDHIVTGTRLGMDGFVYVSVGDKGIPNATGSDGSVISLEGGGVVRMRLDGSQLEIFSTGTRNHLDVAMDSLDNIFTYDNTDDGLGWWTRFTHHIPTGYYGYPFDYHPHPERHLPAISEHGGGSPVGAACYRGAVWPKKYWDADFHCEWGKRKIQTFYPKPAGATFDATMEDFMIPTEGDEFRPQDLCFSPDGKYMYVADWQYGGWTNPKVAGRIYRVSYTGDLLPEPPRAANEDPIEDQIRSLGHPAHHERMRAQWELSRRGESSIQPLQKLLATKDSPPMARVHGIWALAEISRHVGSYDPTPDFVSALKDPDPVVRAQAARAIGTLRLKDAEEPLIALLADADPTVRLHTAVALGRIGEGKAAQPLFEALAEKDRFARFAMIQALRAIDQWEPALASVSVGNPTRTQATLIALTGEYDLGAVDALAAISTESDDPEIRAQAVEALSEVYKESAPYTGGWWGTRPAAGKPRREKNQDWEGTEKVLEAIHGALEDASPSVRIASLAAQEKIGEPVEADLLRELVKEDPASEVRIEAIHRLAETSDPKSSELLANIAGSPTEEETVRSVAVEALVQVDPSGSLETLRSLLDQAETPAPVRVASLDGVTKLKDTESRLAVRKQLTDSNPIVRRAAVEAMAAITGRGAGISIIPLLDDPDLEVRITVIRTLGDIKARDAASHLIPLANNPELRLEIFRTLNKNPDRAALSVYLNGVLDKSPDIRELAAESLLALKERILPDLVKLHEKNELSPELRRELGNIFSQPLPVMEWQVLAAWSKEKESVDIDVTQPAELGKYYQVGDRTLEWVGYRGDQQYGRISADKFFHPNSHCWLMAYTTIEAEQPYEMHWKLGCDDQAILWVNGEKIYEELDDGSWSVDDAEGTVQLKQGTNLIYFKSGNSGGDWAFSLAVSQYDPRLDFLYQDVAPELDIEAYRDFALNNDGNPKHGEELFMDQNGIGCVKCHSVGETGDAAIGPNLAGIGTKYEREELVRSVLEPSNRIESGYELTLIETFDEEFIDGIVQSETEREISLVNADGEAFTVKKEDVRDRRKSALSMMPNGLEKGMTLQDFADIIAYLRAQKETPKRSE
ncbi:MAG: HEAT repeat domain-containing protein [Candidatus Omnitrophica bacterium]|nr:HEAT repeat domain-containing protein [Candidatus Omnitrophota bacterium]